MKAYVLIGFAIAGMLTACGGSRFEALEIDSETNLPELESGSYVAWVEVGTEPVKVGSFQRVPATLDASTVDLPMDARAVFITVESQPDVERPSDSRLVQGMTDPTTEEAVLEATVDTSRASGSFILRTPTDDDTALDNDAAGVWFLDPTEGDPVAALELPEPPRGWVWQGWVETQGRVLSTGRFASVDEQDSACTTCGDGAVPTFPGEDFVRDLPEGLESVKLDDGDSEVVVALQPGSLANDTDPVRRPFLRVLRRRVDRNLPAATPERLDAGDPMPRLRARWRRE